jgi:hypothetical protein
VFNIAWRGVERFNTGFIASYSEHAAQIASLNAPYDCDLRP